MGPWDKVNLSYRDPRVCTTSALKDFEDVGLSEDGHIGGYGWEISLRPCIQVGQRMSNLMMLTTRAMCAGV